MVSFLFSVLVVSLPGSMKVNLNSSTAALFGLTSLPATSPLHAHSYIPYKANLVVTYKLFLLVSRNLHMTSTEGNLDYFMDPVNVFQYLSSDIKGIKWVVAS